jgi:hypothetical protein
MDQRHIAAITAAGPSQIGIAPTAAGLAPHQHADIAGAERGPRRRQFMVVGTHPLDWGWS